jgi:hypothetical protein
MSLRIQDVYTVSEKTAEVAHAVFPNGNIYLKLFDTFGAACCRSGLCCTVSRQRSASPFACPLNVGPNFTIYGRTIGSAGSRCGPIADLLEVPVMSGTDRSGL